VAPSSSWVSPSFF